MNLKEHIIIIIKKCVMTPLSVSDILWQWYTVSKMGWQVCLRNWERGKFDWRRLFKVYVSSPSRCFDFQVRQSSSENHQPGISCSSWGNKENASNSSLSFWSCKAHCWIAFIEVTWCKLLTLEKDRLQRHPLQITFFF